LYILETLLIYGKTGEDELIDLLETGGAVEGEEGVCSDAGGVGDDFVGELMEDVVVVALVDVPLSLLRLEFQSLP
jgi:hypothetical protein